MVFVMLVLARAAAIVVFALAASAYYRPAKFFNIAYAAVFPLGPYCMSGLVTLGVSPWAAAVLGIAVAGFAGWLCDWVVFAALRRRGSSPLQLMIASLGLFIVLTNALAMTAGSEPRLLPDLSWGVLANLSGTSVSPGQAALMLVTGFALALSAPIMRTKAGLEYRATASNSELANVLGLRVERTLGMSCATGGAIGAIGSLLLVTDTRLVITGGFAQLFAGVACVLIVGEPRVGRLVAASVALASVEMAVGEWLGFGWVETVTYVVVCLTLCWRGMAASRSTYWAPEGGEASITIAA